MLQLHCTLQRQNAATTPTTELRKWVQICIFIFVIWISTLHFLFIWTVHSTQPTKQEWYMCIQKEYAPILLIIMHQTSTVLQNIWCPSDCIAFDQWTTVSIMMVFVHKYQSVYLKSKLILNRMACVWFIPIFLNVFNKILIIINVDNPWIVQ